MQSVMNVQAAWAKALPVDRRRLVGMRSEGDVLGAHRVLLEAFETDVRSLLARYRASRGLERDPVDAFRAGGSAEQGARDRAAIIVDVSRWSG